MKVQPMPPQKIKTSCQKCSNFQCITIFICIQFYRFRQQQIGTFKPKIQQSFSRVTIQIGRQVMRKILSRNPFNGHIRKEYDYLSKQQLEEKIKKSEDAVAVQAKRTIQQRAKLIGNMARVFERNEDQLAEHITTEMGKPITQSLGEVRKTISFCKYYSQNYQPLFPTAIKSDAKKKTLIKYNPLGIIYYIVPFNFPFYLMFKGGLPNLLIGNTLLTRNADSCPGLGEFTEKLMAEAGFDSGEYLNVFTSHDQIDTILSHNSVGGVSFTGSSRAGSFIASKAGQYLKKSVMELGGNDSFVVLIDADVNKAVADAIRGRSANCGQVCFSPKRFIIVKQHYQTFKTKLIEGLSKLKYGDPMKPDTQVGPLARDDIYDNLADQLKHLPKSYQVIWQRQDVQRPFFPFTVIEGTDQVYDHETFGPVFTLFCAQDEEHAVQLANSGTYGLGANVYSQSRGEEVIDRIRCGMGFVNDVVKSDTAFPSGGVGRSGYGRECGTEGYKQFANIKVHYIN